MVGGKITQCAGAGYCDCCQRKHFGGVRKLVELKKGLTVYHAPREVEEKDETNSIKHQVSRSLPKLGDSPAVTRVINTNPDHVKKMQADDKMVFILHNTNYDDIPSEEFLPEFDINSVNCPRCQYIMIRAKTLLESLPIIVGKNMIRCVCDLCKLQQRSRVPCHFCQSIVKQFLATEIRHDRIKEHFKSFLANAARDLSLDSKIGKHKEKKPCSDTVTQGINEIGDLIEIRKSNLIEKDVDSISIKLKKVKKVIIKTPETVIPTEDFIADVDKDTDGKLSTIKLHPVVKPSSYTGLHKQVVRSNERVKQSLFHSEQIPCKSFSDTVLGIGTTGLKQLSSSELSLSLAIKKAALKEPMKFFFPRELKENKMKLDETSYFDLIEDTKKRLKAEADEKLIKQARKGKESTIADKTKLSGGDEFKENEKYARNIESKEDSKASKSSGGKSTKENLAKFGEKKIKKDYQKKGIESSKIKEGGIKIKREKEIIKSKGKGKGKESTIPEKTKLSKSDKKYDETREKKGEGSKGSKSIRSGKSKGTPVPPPSRGKSEVKMSKTEQNLAKIGEKKIKKDYQKKGIEKIEEGGIKAKEEKEKSQKKMDGVAKKEHDEQVQTVIEEEADQIEESRNISTVEDKMLKTVVIKERSPRGQKLPSAKKKQDFLKTIEKIPENSNIKDELNLLKKVMEKHINVKTDNLKHKARHEANTTKFRKEADRKSKLLQNAGDAPYVDIKEKRHKYVQSENPEPEAEPKKKEIQLKLNDIQLKTSYDDLILRLIQKHRQVPLQTLQTVETPTTGRKICKFKARHTVSVDDDDSEETDKLEMKTESEVIFGSTIITKQHLPPPPEPQAQPILFQFVLKDDGDSGPINEQATTTEAPDSENNVGVFKYALSDHTYIKNGWTMLPVEKIIRKMNVYRMRPAQPEFDWFERNKGKGPLFYDSGEKLAEVTDIGRGRWYYKNGRLALDYYNAEDINAQQRFVIYSSGDMDARGQNYPVTVLGMFDFKGNGVVFDHKGKIRLKYNQTEGVVLDRGLGPVCHWLWHSLNEPPVLQQVMIDTRLRFTDPTIYAYQESEDDLRHDDETMAAIEFDNYVKTQNTKLTQKFTPYQINMKALKINDQFSLKVLDQKTVYLIFREGANTMKLNLGMVLDHTEVVNTTSAELGEVALDMEETPAKTASIAELQKSLLNAQRVHRLRTERVLKKRPLAPGLSVDKLVSATSKSPPAPLLTTNVVTNYSKCEIPIANNLYINTRLI